mgnify:CR=1 FL=1
MVTVEVQQVTTWSKTKQSDWEIQEAVRKVAKEWVDEANNNNVSSMLQENTELNITPPNSEIRLKEVLEQSR